MLPKHAEELCQGVKELVDYSLLQRNDRIVRDSDAFRADLGAALGDVAQADAIGFAQARDAILGVERIHFKRGDVDEKSRSDELIVHVVIAQNVAYVLAQVAFDALAELLDAVDILLLHAPRAVRRIRFARLELF